MVAVCEITGAASQPIDYDWIRLTHSIDIHNTAQRVNELDELLRRNEGIQ